MAKQQTWNPKVEGEPSPEARRNAIRFILQAETNDSAAPKDGAAPGGPYSVVSLAGPGGDRPIPSAPLQALSAASSYPGRP